MSTEDTKGARGARGAMGAMGAMWILPEFPQYWIRPHDGALVNSRTNRLRFPTPSRGKGVLVHRLAGTSRTLPSLLDSLDLALPPATFDFRLLGAAHRGGGDGSGRP